LFRKRVEALGEAAVSRVGFRALIGFATLFVAPIAVVILVVSMLGAVVGIIGALAFILLMFLTLALMSVVAGSFLALVVTKKPTVSIVSILAGAVVTQAALFVPIVGPALLIVLFFVTLGSIVFRGYHAVR
jgi:hypothetical protein